jgi:hypothetical protein
VKDLGWVKVLERWRDNLNDIAPGIPWTRIVHGYAGRWKITADYDTWGGIRIRKPNFATATGEAVFDIQRDGTSGTGIAELRLDVEISTKISTFLMTAMIGYYIDRMQISTDGSVFMEGSIFARHILKKKGKPPKETRLVEGTIPTPNRHMTSVHPSPDEPGKLIGTQIWFAGSKNMRSRAQLGLEKLHGHADTVVPLSLN